jgi:hypothetical protein
MARTISFAMGRARPMRRLLVPATAVLLVTACDLEFEKATVAEGTGRPVVHAVLNPFVGSEFTVIVERTLTGRVAVREGVFDPADPVASGGGDPITGARVEINNLQTGDGSVGIEDAEVRDDGKGRGVYRFLNASCGPFACPVNGIVMSRGMPYELRVTTPNGEVITDTTRIPTGFARPDTGSRRTFNADGETYSFSWRRSDDSVPRYAVQLQTPYGPFQVFSSVESLAVNGTLRNFQQDRLPRAFVPGFRQNIQAIAVDRNYFDYYRSQNDPFTGLGLASSVNGGFGVFGAIHPIRFQELDVTATIDEPVEGRWTLVGDVSGFPPRLTTYVDGDFASGRLEDVFDPAFRSVRAIIGSRDGATLRLHVLNSAALAIDTAWTLVGEVRGDTLFTTSTVKGDQKWRRIAAAP